MAPWSVVYQAERRAERRRRWEVDEWVGRIVSKRSGLSVGIGDIVTVRIERIDTSSRHLDLVIADVPQVRETVPPDGGRLRKSKPKSSPKGKGKGYKQGRRGRRGR